MNRCLILGVCFATAATAASAIGAQDAAQPQQKVPEAKTIAVQATKQAQQPAPVRHLSEQERAELRRQLLQFNQQFIRRP